MRLRKFVGPNAAIALREVKRELGDEALILGTREVTGGVEITAATDGDLVLDPFTGPPPVHAGAIEADEPRLEVVQGLLRGVGAQLRRMERRLPAELPSAAAAAAMGKSLDSEARELAETLANNGLPPGKAYDIAERFGARRATGSSFDKALAGAIVEWLPSVQNTSAANVRFLVGPTGSGKTTTIAKLAADDVLAGRPRPLLINADTVRIGAGEQLAGIGRLLEVEVCSVNEVSELHARIAGEDGRRPVYVDTAGLSSDAAIHRSIGAMLDGCQERPSVTAVVSATAARSSLQRAWSQLEGLRPDGCAVTHVDESDEPGTACSWLGDVGLPLRWFGTGQSIPDDLTAATGDNVALWLVAV